MFFFEKRTFLAVSSVCNGEKPGKQVACCLDFQESHADDKFSAMELQMPRSWVGEDVAPFFGAINENVLHSENLESCFVELCKNGSVVNEQCATW